MFWYYAIRHEISLWIHVSEMVFSNVFFGVKVFSNVILNKISAYMYIYKLHIASLISYALVHVSSLFGT